MNDTIEQLPPGLLHLTVAQMLKWIVVIVLIVSAMVWFKKYVWPFIKRTTEFLEDWNGEPERPGQPARLGLMQRIANIEYEFQPNSGASFSDKVNKIVITQASHIEQIEALQKDVNKIKRHLNIDDTDPLETIKEIGDGTLN